MLVNELKVLLLFVSFMVRITPASFARGPDIVKSRRE